MLKKKYLMIFLFLVIAISAVSAVSAEDAANASEVLSDDVAISEEPLASDEIADDTLAAKENDDTLKTDANEKENVLEMQNTDEEPLSMSAPGKIKLNVYKQTGKYASDKKIYFKATDASSGDPIYVSDNSLKISCTVGGKTYHIKTSTNSKGEGSFKWPAPKMTSGGTFKMKLTVESIFGCEVGYNPYTIKVSIASKTAKQAATTKPTRQVVTIIPYKLSTSYKSGKYFKAKVINSKTKKPVKGVAIILKVYTGKKAKAFTLKSNAKGIVNYKSASKLKIGTHKVVLKVKKSKYFSGKTKKSYIKISKAKSNKRTVKLHTKLTVKECYRVDYTQYYFKVILKDSKGHAVANRNIIIETDIIFSGSSGMTVYHYATTNSKGVAQGYIKPVINGAVEYSATFKFEGDKSYYASSAHKYAG